MKYNIQWNQIRGLMFICLTSEKLKRQAAVNKPCVGRAFLMRSVSSILLPESLTYYPLFGEKEVVVCFKKFLYGNMI